MLFADVSSISILKDVSFADNCFFYFEKSNENKKKSL